MDRWHGKARKCKGRVYVNNPNSLHHLLHSTVVVCFFPVCLLAAADFKFGLYITPAEQALASPA